MHVYTTRIQKEVKRLCAPRAGQDLGADGGVDHMGDGVDFGLHQTSHGYGIETHRGHARGTSHHTCGLQHQKRSRTTYSPNSDASAVRACAVTLNGDKGM